MPRECETTHPLRYVSKAIHLQFQFHRSKVNTVIVKWSTAQPLDPKVLGLGRVAPLFRRSPSQLPRYVRVNHQIPGLHSLDVSGKTARLQWSALGLSISHISEELDAKSQIECQKQKLTRYKMYNTIIT